MTQENIPVIVAAKRTAIGQFGGSLASLSATQLGSAVIKALLNETKIDGATVDEVIMGQVLTAGEGQNTARQSAIMAGLPYTVPAVTINKVCGSGLKAVQLAAQAIQCGDAEIVIAGGQENMSRSVHVLQNSREGKKMGDWPLTDTMLTDGLWCAMEDYHMGITAENIAADYGIDRTAQDAFAAQSQQRAEKAQGGNQFAAEIIPVSVPQRKAEPIIFDTDEYPRAGTTIEKLSTLRPAFQKEGTVTAGNASGLNDGAAALIIMSKAKAEALNLTPMAEIKAAASTGVAPRVMGTGPIPATQKCLDKAGWSVDDLDLIEANEAFAAQALSVVQDLKLDPAKVNIKGGAIALGHPIGASGARILVTLLHTMAEQNAQKGLATLCIGGGQGIALAVERAG